jgi:hypothetical protein
VLNPVTWRPLLECHHGSPVDAPRGVAVYQELEEARGVLAPVQVGSRGVRVRACLCACCVSSLRQPMHMLVCGLIFARYDCRMQHQRRRWAATSTAIQACGRMQGRSPRTQRRLPRLSMSVRSWLGDAGLLRIRHSSAAGAPRRQRRSWGRVPSEAGGAGQVGERARRPQRDASRACSA